MYKPPTQAALQKQIDDWNAKHPIGTQVKYWRGVKEGEPSGIGPTCHAATILGGHTAVAWITGSSGCISLTHVEGVEEDELERARRRE